MAHQRFQFGADNSHTNYMLSRTINGNPNLSGCSVTVQGTTPVNTTQHLIVVRIDFKPGAERVFQWIDPISCIVPDTANVDAKMSACDFRFNAVNIGAGSSANYDFDELRIGLQYNDVVNCATGFNVPMAMLPELSIIPNPNNGQFRLRFASNENSAATMTITNELGQSVMERSIELIIGENEIPVELFDRSGIYFVIFRDEAGNTSKGKLLLQSEK